MPVRIFINIPQCEHIQCIDFNHLMLYYLPPPPIPKLALMNILGSH